METYKVEPRTRLQEVFSKDQLVIPFLQRPFSWKPTEVVDYLEFILDRMGRRPEVCAAQIIILHDLETETRQVMDGQQRILSYVIYAIAMVSVTPEDPAVREAMRRFLTVSKNDGKLRIVSNYKNDNDALCALVAGRPEDCPRVGRVYEAYKACQSMVVRRRDTVPGFNPSNELTQLMTRVLFTVTVVWDAEDAAEHFQIINTTGRRLTRYQRTKMMCMAAVTTADEVSKTLLHNRLEELHAMMPGRGEDTTPNCPTSRMILLCSELMQGRVLDEMLNHETDSLKLLLKDVKPTDRFGLLCKCLDKAHQLNAVRDRLESTPAGTVVKEFLPWDAYRLLVLPFVAKHGDGEHVDSVVSVLAAHCVRRGCRPRPDNSISGLSRELRALLPMVREMWDTEQEPDALVSAVRRSLAHFHRGETSDEASRRLAAAEFSRGLAMATLMFIKEDGDPSPEDVLVKIGNTANRGGNSADVLGTYELMKSRPKKRQQYGDAHFKERSVAYATRIDALTAGILGVVDAQSSAEVSH